MVGRRDAMTPPRAAKALADALSRAGVPVDTVMLEAGHALMTEQPDATLDALFSFAAKAAGTVSYGG
jgi:pimeloyl-ACP methyl ester carboxylesterase